MFKPANMELSATQGPRRSTTLHGRPSAAEFLEEVNVKNSCRNSTCTNLLREWFPLSSMLLSDYYSLHSLVISDKQVALS